VELVGSSFFGVVLVFLAECESAHDSAGQPDFSFPAADCLGRSSGRCRGRFHARRVPGGCWPSELASVASIASDSIRYVGLPAAGRWAAGGP